MTLVKTVRRPGARAIVVASGVLWIILVALAIVLIDNTAVRVAVGAAALLAAGWVIAGVRRPRHSGSRCPECGSELGPAMTTAGKGGEPMLRPCAACDVIWHVGTAPRPPL